MNEYQKIQMALSYMSLADLNEEEENLIKKWIDERVEFESRKDKLIVGSVWECVATNYGEDWCWRKGTDVVITELADDDLVSFSDIKYKNIQDEQPDEQFMVCFKPKEAA